MLFGFSRGGSFIAAVVGATGSFSWPGQPPGMPAISARPFSRICSLCALTKAALSTFLEGNRRSMVEFSVPRRVSPTPCSHRSQYLERSIIQGPW